MDKIYKLINDNPRLFSFLAALLPILVFYHFRYGLQVFDPTYINWIIDDIELANGYFSFGYFRHQDWGFPIGEVKSYFYPLGTNLYTADIPILALFFKPFSSILPADFQYLGLCYLICHLLQAWFSILLCERLGINGLTRILVVIFFLFTPLLMTRFIHPCLFCQWIILAGFWIYLLDPEKTPVRKILLYQFILFLVSGLIFAYMWAIAFGFSLALFLRLWLFDKKIKLIRAVVIFSLHTVLMVFLWLLIGLISFGGIPNYKAEGWGDFSTNINALYNPMNTASLMPTFPFFQLQHLEGYAYLGIGILLLILISFIIYAVNLFSRKQKEKHHLLTIENINVLPLLLFVLFSAIYAITNKVTFNQSVLFEFKLGESFSFITNSFRASGRLFWPVYYFIIMVLFYYLAKVKLDNLAKNTILGACLVLQLYDLQYFLKPLHFKYEGYKPPINAAWENLIKTFDQTVFYPGFRMSYLKLHDYRYFAYYTTLYQKRINVGYPARFDRARAAALIGELGTRITTEGLDDNTLYISFIPYLNRLALPIYNNEAYCFSIDGYLAIFKKTERTKAIFEFLQEKIGNENRDEIVSQFTISPWKGWADSIVTKNAKTGIYGADNTDDIFHIQGWAFHEKSKDALNDSIYIVLESPSRKRWIAPAHRVGTQDVADFFKNPELALAGFSRTILKKDLKTGAYRVGLLFTNKKTNLRSLYWLDHYFKVYKTIDPVLYSKPSKKLLELKHDINSIVDTLGNISIGGWAIPSKGICKSCKPYFIFSSPSLTYAAEANMVPRPDVADFFKDSTLIYSGIELKMRKSPVKLGSYTLGILFKDTLKHIDYYSETIKRIDIKGEEFVKPEMISTLPQETESINAYVDNIVEEVDYVKIDGWAFMEGVSTDNTESCVVLKSPIGSYSLCAPSVLRIDVQNHFKSSHNVERSGFSLKFRKKELMPGEYQLYIMMSSLKTSTMHLRRLDRTIKI